jgi:ribonuclease HI
MSTNGSATKNGWENASASIGVWYANGSERKIALKLESIGPNTAPNSRAELEEILEALRQNERDDLTIESDSVSSLRAICTLSENYEDPNWSGVKSSDLLKSILIKLRTRPARATFKWVKGHADNYANNQADALANEGRISNSFMRVDEEEWLNSHPVLQDGARLQTKHIYKLADQMVHTKHHPNITPRKELQTAHSKPKSRRNHNHTPNQAKS